jgi:hypothetical protein
MSKDLKRLMKEKKNARAEHTKIVSPLARYNNLNQLVCLVCKIIIKSDSLWEPHCQSAQHKKNITQLRELKRKREDDTSEDDLSQIKISDVVTPSHPISTSTQSIDEISESSPKKPKIPDTNSTTSNTDKTEEISIKSKKSDNLNEKSSLESNSMEQSNDTAVFKKPFKKTVANSGHSQQQEKSSVTQTVQTPVVEPHSKDSQPKSILPDSFFDDPKKKSDYVYLQPSMYTPIEDIDKLNEEEMTLNELIEHHTKSRKRKVITEEEIIEVEELPENHQLQSIIRSENTNTTIHEKILVNNEGDENESPAEEYEVIKKALPTFDEYSELNNSVTAELLYETLEYSKSTNTFKILKVQAAEFQASKQQKINDLTSSINDSESKHNLNHNTKDNQNDNDEEDEDEDDMIVNWRSKGY